MASDEKSKDKTEGSKSSSSKRSKVEVDPELLDDSGTDDQPRKKKAAKSSGTRRTVEDKADRPRTRVERLKARVARAGASKEKDKAKVKDKDMDSGSVRRPAVGSRLGVKRSSSDSSSSSNSSKRSGSSSRSSSRSTSRSRPSSSSRDDDSGDEVSRLNRRYLRIPTWGWLLLATAGLGVAMVVVDLRNRDRFLMVCQGKTLELHQGQRLPWPFGHEQVGGVAYQPVTLSSAAECRAQVFHGRLDAERGLLEFLIAQVKATLARPGQGDLKQARRQVVQAMLLTRSNRTRQAEVTLLQAELSYRQGRNGLARVEDELRLALARFREAQRLNASGYKDLDQWITHLQQLLPSVSPSPAKMTPAAATEAPKPQASDLSPPSPEPAKPDAGPPAPESPDAGKPAEGSGILM